VPNQWNFVSKMKQSRRWTSDRSVYEKIGPKGSIRFLIQWSETYILK
jgi:hypothetical protein